MAGLFTFRALLFLVMTWWCRPYVGQDTEQLSSVIVSCKARFDLHYFLSLELYKHTCKEIGCMVVRNDRREGLLTGNDIHDSMKYRWNVSYSRDDILICKEDQAISTWKIAGLCAITLMFLILPTLGIERAKHVCLENILLERDKSEDKKTVDPSPTYTEYLSADCVKDLHKSLLVQKTLHSWGTSVKTFMKKDTCFWHQGVSDHLEFLLQFRRVGILQQPFTAAPASSLFSHFVRKPAEFQHTTNMPAGNGCDFHREGVRLASFRTFPETVPVSALRLAQAGFYYAGDGDQVVCFSCGEAHSNWQAGDRPHVIHSRMAPHCLFVRGMDQRNQPLPLTMTITPDFSKLSAQNTLDTSHSSPTTETSAGMERNQPHGISGGEMPDTLSGTAVMSSSTPEDSGILTLPVSFQGSANQALDQFSHAMSSGHREISRQEMPSSSLDLRYAVYPLYSQLDARRRSFQTWQHRNGLPSIDELVTLGFFYAGYADCVRCFFCGIGLKSWEPEDNPAQVHASWRPTCQYLRLVKGDGFVDRVAEGEPGDVPPVEDQSNIQSPC